MCGDLAEGNAKDSLPSHGSRLSLNVRASLLAHLGNRFVARRLPAKGERRDNDIAVEAKSRCVSVTRCVAYIAQALFEP